MTLSLEQVAKASLALVLIVILAILLYIYIPGFRDTILGLGGIDKEETQTHIQSDPNYITLKDLKPGALNKGLFPHGPNDWVGSKEPTFPYGTSLTLTFDKPIDKTSAEICTRIWVSKKDTINPPTKPDHWIFIDKDRRNSMIEINEKEMEIIGFKDPGRIGYYYYNIEFTQCFKSTDDKPINPEAEIIKFRITQPR